MKSAYVLFVLLASCQSTAPGAHPHEMSAAAHEREAARHEQLACAPGSVCWTSRTDFEAHRKAADQHRAASAALRDAEATACAGIPEADRDMSPFEHYADIAGIESLVETTQGSKQATSRTTGVTVTVRAVPGLTTEWLQRIVDCHLARNAALGHVVPEMPNCPLVPNGVTAQVRSVRGGFAVDIRSDDSDAVAEVRARASRMVATR